MEIIKLRIADKIIQMQSDFLLKRLTREERQARRSERYDNFSYRGKTAADILIEVKIVERLPEFPGARPVFITYHFQDGEENWRMQKYGKDYIYRCSLQSKRQVMLVSRNFDHVTAYLLPGWDGKKVWDSADIIYDFLQVLLINYFALNKKGIFTHSFGVKDLNGKGLLFAGKSRAGKSTAARIWHRHSGAMVLNDDRIIVLKQNGRFFIHGSPWHGNFSDYLASRIESAHLDKMFFIHHASKNRVRAVDGKTAFRLLYPAMFPTFWDKGFLENVASFCQDLVGSVPCYILGFVKDKRVIDFVRNVK
ncbi:MAG: hypothetical protein ACOY3D_02940 [Candidatus Omnitrophota bacterium]